MKFACLGLAVTSSLLAGTQPKPKTALPTGYIVTGNLPASRAKMAYLRYIINAKTQFDSARVTNGHFQFKGRVAVPVKARLTLPQAGTVAEATAVTLYLEPGSITVAGLGAVSGATVSGTPLNRENQQFRTQLKPVQDRLNGIYQPFYAQANTERPDTALQHRVAVQAAPFLQQRQDLYAAYIKAHPTAIFSLLVLEEYDGLLPKPDGYVALYEGLAPSVRNSALGQLAQQKVEKLRQIGVGTPAPAFSQPDSTGKLVRLADWRGHYVLVDFWASWCKPCRAENPHLVKTYATYKAQGFMILSISVDNEKQRAAWLKAIRYDGLTWPQASDLKGMHNEAARSYGVVAVPQNFLIDPQGRIVATNLTGEALTKKLTELLPAAK
ncbi:TlpA disulfide reductase family protein [Hymenobacter sp. BT559]|uniref:TlpA disulfide reductase family protein n=1 Tax=Hymenobacter sp. BT559 TaxID=2795729 RepID=UPI0018EA7A3E|nr:TlpA disulfide reductase family protein [Hymenobacter sp. BT559]MBJ6146155.1 AhpC/TSA family protein [Hymenobacter sp. BT559]